MFTRREPQVARRQRAEAERILMIGTQRQNVLAFTVRRVLLQAGFTEAAYDDSAGDGDFGISSKLVTEGFVIEAPQWAHGESSIGVVYASTRGGYNLQTAQPVAETIAKAFRPVAGRERTSQLLVQVKRLSLPTSGISYLNVTIQIPDDKTLRALYWRLGRR